MSSTIALRIGVIIGSALVACALIVFALPAVKAAQPSISQITGDKNVTASAGGMKITQSWTPSIAIMSGLAQVTSASCKNGEAVVGGGYQISGPDGVVLFAGPSLSLNSYAVQVVNNGQSTLLVQVYATCIS